MNFLIFTILIIFTQLIQSQNDFYFNLSNAACELTKQKVIYDPKYFKISYPNGEIPNNKGVCSDVIIRAYRKVGIDLQKEIHEDMSANFSLYPKIWGLTSTDTNIDHRRVSNLMRFFSRKGKVLPITQDSKDYQPGHLVCWNLGNGRIHIGIVVNYKSVDEKRNLIVHNIGSGQVYADCLFDYKIIGHYKYKK